MSQPEQSSEQDPTKRFSSRVENYVRFRPGYPKEIIGLLQSECGLNPQSIIADVGFGTGKLTELFLENGNAVFGIEPNREMREAGEHFLKEFSHFTGLATTAEDTALPNVSIDFIVAGQAFHWFDRKCCRKEFARILKPAGWIALIWNERKNQATPFLAAYENILKNYALDYSKVDHKQIDDVVVQEFFGYRPAKKSFPSSQEFDFAGLKGRLLSSSYSPETGQPGHDEMLCELETLFKAQQKNDRVEFIYDTVVYYGKLN